MCLQTSAAADYKPPLNATPCQTHATLTLTKKQMKRKYLIHRLYAEMHHSVYQTYKYSQVNGQYSNNKNTQTRHYTVQYAA